MSVAATAGVAAVTAPAGTGRPVTTSRPVSAPLPGRMPTTVTPSLTENTASPPRTTTGAKANVTPRSESQSRTGLLAVRAARPACTPAAGSGCASTTGATSTDPANAT